MATGFSPQSQQAVDALIAGRALGSGERVVGPLDAKSQALLRVIARELTRLKGLKGESQADELRRLYLEELKKPPEPAPPKADDHVASSGSASGLSWRLGKLTCQSIRGIAPYGEQFEFDFAGKSNLIYGPNGSGKSSLLVAVSWVLLGRPLTDADNPEDTASLHGLPKGAGRGAKIRDWPVMAALPGAPMPVTAAPVYWSQIEMRDPTGKRVLHLKRSGDGQFLESADGCTWIPCTDLAAHGVTPLDLQLSLIAPTAFGRQSLEACSDTRSVLSSMLGYDELELIGELVTNLTGNTTRLQKKEMGEKAGELQALVMKLVSLPEKVPSTHPLNEELRLLAETQDPTREKIAHLEARLNERVNADSKGLASLLGITLDGQDRPSDLADQLIAAVARIEKGIRQSFPSLDSVRLETVLPTVESRHPEVRLGEIESRLAQFETDAKERIAKRYAWWKKGSKAELLLKAAQLYDPIAQECPVCEQSVKDSPAKDELSALKAEDPAMVRDAETVLGELEKELADIVPHSLVAVSDRTVAQLLTKDWARLREDLAGTRLMGPVQAYDQPIGDLIAGTQPVQAAAVSILPSDADRAFAEIAAGLSMQLGRVKQAIAMARWTSRNLQGLEDRLNALISDPAGDVSLLGRLTKGKESAKGIRPLKEVLSELSAALEQRRQIESAEADLEALGQIKDCLGELKGLRGYAEDEVQLVFEGIEKRTIENWRSLYGEGATGLGPGRLDLGKGRDKTVEALLSAKGAYEVPSQHFANAGLKRAIALAFYFALIEQHPGGLGFVVLDDPILSLDEDHREKWSNEVLRPKMDEIQFILATHQRQYLNNCRIDFAKGQTFELIPRQRSGKMAWRPGNRLDRAAEEMARAPTNSPNEMRKYREELFAALELYSSTTVVLNTDSYAALKPPHPLAAGHRERIVKALRDPAICQVLDHGSHAPTEADVTSAMLDSCLKKLRDLDKTVVLEFERLDEQARKSIRKRPILAATRALHTVRANGDAATSLDAKVIGRAAAKSDGCFIEDGEENERLRLAVHCGVLVAGRALDPVAKPGQWVLLADVGVIPQDGDLVAVEDTSGNRYLRRAWSEGDRWILQAINPVEDVPPVVAGKDSPIQKVVGVLYSPCPSLFEKGSGICEWQPRGDFPGLKDMLLVRVEGDSLNPIARRGQYVILGPKADARKHAPVPGSLAALDTTEEGVGQVIKRVFALNKRWLLLSCNPVETIAPLDVPEDKIRSVWPVRGVLFDGAVTEP